MQAFCTNEINNHIDAIYALRTLACFTIRVRCIR